MDQGTASFLGAIVSLGGAIFTVVYGSSVRRREQSRNLMERYRDPLLRSAQELQSRLWNIACEGYLGTYYKAEDPDKPESVYAVKSTMYAVAEYLCWREVMRREMPYLDLGDVAKNTALMQQLNTIEDAFASDRRTTSKTFRLFRHRQRAIGEVLMVDRTRSGPVRLDCIGFAAFTRRVEATESDFASWFKPLEADIRALAVASSKKDARLIDIQGALIGLLDLLDPDRTLVPWDREMIKNPQTKKQCIRPSANGANADSSWWKVWERRGAPLRSHESSRGGGASTESEHPGM